MTDAPPKKRPWFQLHLSTCVVLMFVGAGILWANTRPQLPGYDDIPPRWFGWPKIAFPYLEWPRILREMKWDCFLINAAVGLGILAIMGFGCELGTRTGAWQNLWTFLYGKRKLLANLRFQLHLSTCVVLMFVAGALVWANMRPYELIQSYPIYDYYEFRFWGRGWPIRQTLLGHYPGQFGPNSEEGMNHYLANYADAPDFGQPHLVLCNIGIGIAVLLASTILLEIVIRRRERTRAGSVPGPDTTHAE